MQSLPPHRFSVSSLLIWVSLAGQQYDSVTGTHYNLFRDYDPAVGGYVQSDPLGLLGGWST